MIDWPPIEGLLLFVQKHGIREAADRLGCPATTLRSHLYAQGFTADDYSQRRRLNDDALEEIRALID